MMFNKATVFAAVAALSQVALGQEETPDGQVKMHTVTVGPGLKFVPEEITAGVGEMIQFQFWPRNHSVAQSTFDEPCVPISEAKNGNGTQGFFSGFMPVTEDSETMPVFTIEVQDEKPIWFYCATGAHCQGGMVGVINAPKNNPDRTLAKYREAAAKAKTEVPEEEEFGGEEGTIPKNGTTTPPTGSPTGSAPPSSSSTPPGDSDGAASSLHMSGFTVALGALAAAFFLA